MQLRKFFCMPLIVLTGGLVTLSLFVFMQSLIAMGVDGLDKKPAQRVADFLMPEHELSLIEKQQKPEKPELAKQPPPQLDVQLQDLSNPDTQQLRLAPMKMSLDIELGGIGLGVSDGEYLPLVRPPPVYPRYAQSRGLEGYVIIEFIVTESGKVISPQIIEANPEGVFDNAALRAVKNYKYKPKMVDGSSVDVTGVRQKFTFKLDKTS